jgi:hypothetical protein
LTSTSTPEREAREAFRRWFSARWAGYQAFKAEEGSVLTFADYLVARDLFIKENEKSA